MAHYEACKAITMTAGSAVTKYRFVKFASDGAVDHVASAQGDFNGVSGETVAAGDTLPMMVPDGAVAMVEAGDAITAGADVASDNQGRVIPLVDTAGNLCAGTAIQAAGAAGDVIAVQFYAKKVALGS